MIAVAFSFETANACRARRAVSHHQLPPEERNVDVYVFVASMTSDQQKLHAKDGGRTSDEHVHAVAQRKRKLLQKLLSVMRTAAVDCSSWGHLEPGEACVAPPPGAGPDHRMYHADVNDDVRNASGAIGRKLVAVKRGGVLYYADLSTGELFDHEALKRHNRVVRVGRVTTPYASGG